MENVKVGRYENPEQTGFAGWIEPSSQAWIVFVGIDGQAVFFGKRGPGGEVVG